MPVAATDLAKLFPLDALRPETREQLGAEASITEYRRNETIFNAGDLDDDTVYILDGEVKCTYPDGRVVPRLRQPMYYYRNFIAEGARGQQLAPLFLEQSKQALQDYNLGLSKPLCLGLILEIENKRLAAEHNEAQWKETGFTFIGYSPKGLTLRVWYFEGVRLFAPAPLKKPARQRVAARA